MTPFRRTDLSKAVACVLALPLLFARQAAAQTPAPDAAVTLDRLKVTGERMDAGAGVGTGSRLALRIAEVPATVISVGRDTLDARGVRTTQEALAAIPGLVAASPPGHGNAVTWRGFSGSQISQLFNGIDVKYASIAARPVDAWIYDRVEAVGGPSSFLHGAGAVGGSINYITRLASRDADDLQWMAAGGSHGSGVLAGGVNRLLGGPEAPGALRVDLGYSTSDGWMDRAHRESLTSAASLLTRLTDDVDHTFAVEYQKEDSDRPYWGTPAILGDDGRLRALPGTRRRNYNVSDGHYGQEVLWLRSLLAWRASERSRLSNTLYHYDALRDYRNVESYAFNDRVDGVIRSGTLLQRHDQQVYGNRLDWNWDGEIAALQSRWAAGLEVSYNRQTRFPLSIPGIVDEVPLDAVTPGSFFDVPGTSRTYAPDRTNRLHTRALTLENITWLADSLSLLTSLRHERIDLDVVNHREITAGNPARYRRDYASTTGRAGLNVEFAQDRSLYLQYSTAADPPAGILSTASFSTLRDFDLSTGHQLELGSKLRFLEGRATATAAVYRIVRRNLAIADPENPGQTRPVGQQSARGAEFALSLRPTGTLNIDANLSWSDATLDDYYENVSGVPVSRAGNRPTNTPSRVANLWLDYAMTPAWSAGMDLRAVAPRFADAANTVETPGYVILGAHLRWNLADAGSLTLRGRNLGDITYVAHAIGTEMIYLGEPSSFEIEWRSSF
ncbi:TonB-dependent receptor [Luteimonas sp. R10]|uniref:TonB-dependent receptor n=1 Tax=Luteimonas sp. R10 TaxID=3108176 RepID=UPI00308D4ED5|nr:TonB-dependent receptor [Luteimonas sp. R10]